MKPPTATIRRSDGVHQFINPLALQLLLLLSTSLVVFAQQPYLNNLQFACYVNHTETEGFTCNGAPSCTSYLTYWSSLPSYVSVPSIAFLLSAKESDIATANNVSDVATFPAGHAVLVPVNCNCTAVYTATDSDGKRRQQKYYQHNATYTLKRTLETYLTVANDTYGGLTTCQAMMAQNPVDSYNLTVGLKLVAPLMCACPSTNQTAKGFKYIVTYLADWDDDVTTIAGKFGVDEQVILDANELTPDRTIFPFTPILVPLKSRPSNLNLNPNTSSPSPPPSSSLSPPPPSSTGGGGGDSKWLYVGVGIGASLLIIGISSLVFCLFVHRRRRLSSVPVVAAPTSAEGKGGMARKAAADGNHYGLAEYKAVAGVGSGGNDDTSTSNNSWSISSSGVKYAIESLTLYKFDELQRATGNFSESNRIKGSVFRGYFNGNRAAVKMMKADVSAEINILKQINHSSIVRLSGFCIQSGNTYLVYEYAEKGCLQDWLLLRDSDSNSSSNDHNGVSSGLSWKQRVQIAHDMADGLNYLHNYTNPPYIHKNLTSSNVMLDGNLRAKMTNFGLARSINNSSSTQMSEDDDGLMHMHLTRHVVGTKGYLAPELIESGVVTPKLDVFAFGMILGELLSGRIVSSTGSGNDDNPGLTASSIRQVIECENARVGVRSFIDPAMGFEYPLDLACSMAQLANDCLQPDLNSRPFIAEVLTALSKIRSASMDWDPSDDLNRTSSVNYGR